MGSSFERTIELRSAEVPESDENFGEWIVNER